MREVRNAYKSLVAKPEGKIPLGETRRKWRGNTLTWILNKYGVRMWTSLI
jgi:hypothetical protein